MIKRLKNLDIWLYLLPIVFSTIGVALIYSLVYAKDAQGLIIKQIMAFVIGISAMFILSFYDYRHFRNANYIIYAVALILLLIVDFWGKTSGGATRWIEIGALQIQPSEILKLVIAIFFASYFADKVGDIGIKEMIVSTVAFLIPIYLVLIQPDLGTALVLISIFIAVIFSLKLTLRKKTFLWLAIGLIFLIALLSINNYGFFGKLMKDYQRDRIEVFLDPSSDPKGRGYNVRQALIAVGSGGIVGQGLGKGTQSQLQFLPKSHTDFIFSGYAEAFGFVGSSLLIIFFGFLIFRIFRAANLAKDNFGMILSIGIGAMFLFQVVENIGMNIGVLPVTGIPLPFISYGGSSLVVNFAAVGIVQSIIMRHKKIAF